MINIAELLKDCPKGMELDCSMFDNVTFVGVDNKRIQFPIEIAIGGLHSKYLTKEGCFHNNTLIPEAKCVIFPKGKTTWEGFVPPIEFKNGDIVISSLGCIHILKDPTTSYCHLGRTGFLDRTLTNNIRVVRLATEKEKQKLFDAFKARGYRWNAETKTLEMLSQFKVGDRIRHKSYNTIINTISYIYSGGYVLCDGYLLYFKEQDNWELVPDIKPIFKVGNKIKDTRNNSEGIILKITDEGYECHFEFGNFLVSFKEQHHFKLVPHKFDINTLKPFDKVLVRIYHEAEWKVDFFSHYTKEADFPYNTVGKSGWYYCIPYKGNEYLLGTTNDCDDFYKTWEE